MAPLLSYSNVISQELRSQGQGDEFKARARCIPAYLHAGLSSSGSGRGKDSHCIGVRAACIQKEHAAPEVGAASLADMGDASSNEWCMAAWRRFALSCSNGISHQPHRNSVLVEPKHAGARRLHARRTTIQHQHWVQLFLQARCNLADLVVSRRGAATSRAEIMTRQ